MSSPETTAPQTEADLPIEDFISRAAARERGEDIPLIEEADQASSADGAPLSDAVSASVEKSADRTVSADKPIDKRTREGRKATIQQEIDELTTTKHTTAKEVETA